MTKKVKVSKKEKNKKRRKTLKTGDVENQLMIT